MAIKTPQPLTKLEKKIKATLLIENSMGAIVYRNVWLHAYGIQNKNTGFDDKVVAHYTIKGKRKKRGTRFERAAIAKGWQEVTNASNHESSTGFTSFENGRFEACLEELNNILIQG